MQKGLWFSGPGGLECHNCRQRPNAGSASKSNTSLGQAGATKVWGLELLLVTPPVLIPPSSDAQGLGMVPVSVGSRESMCSASHEAGLSEKAGGT